jgi:hypothetical protein
MCGAFSRAHGCMHDYAVFELQAHAKFRRENCKTCVQVNFSTLSAHPAFGFAPSRAYGQRPAAAVLIDAVPPIDREHMFTPPDAVAAGIDRIQNELEACAAAETTVGVIFNRTGHAIVTSALSAVLADFASIKTVVALPSEAQMDTACLENCFTSSQKVGNSTSAWSELCMLRKLHEACTVHLL